MEISRLSASAATCHSLHLTTNTTPFQSSSISSLISFKFNFCISFFPNSSTPPVVLSLLPHLFSLHWQHPKFPNLPMAFSLYNPNLQPPPHTHTLTQTFQLLLSSCQITKPPLPSLISKTSQRPTFTRNKQSLVLTMENFQPPPFLSTTTITSSTSQETQSQSAIFEPMSCFPSTSCTPGAVLYNYYPAQNLAPNPGLQFQYGYDYSPYQQAVQPMTPFLASDQQNMVLSMEDDSLESKRAICKAARNHRRMVRQRSISLSRNNANAAASSGVSSSSRRHAPPYGCKDDLQNTKKHLYPFCTPNNKKLRVLFKKVLKKSDIGSLGRIVLPKKEAEENLPKVSDKDGIHLVIRDVHSDQEWSLKYKYWSNNRSRMYVLENAGGFVRQMELQAGDCIYLYEDECKNLYISSEKIARPAQVAEPSSSPQLTTTTDHPENPNIHNSSRSSSNPIPDFEVFYTKLNTTTTTDANKHQSITTTTTTKTNENVSAQHTYEAMDEGDTSSVALLMEQQQQQELESSSVALSRKPSSSSAYTQNEEAAMTTSSTAVTSSIKTFTQPSTLAGFGPLSSSSTSSSSLQSRRTRRTDDDQFDDCYKGLGTLPEVDRYKYSDYLFDDDSDDVM